ncbi:MAG: tRNA pseudouridine(55) synthase TruB [Frankiaceae bacterium]
MSAGPVTEPARQPAPDGLVVVDKPAGWTSHDVVARLRRLAATRRVGHAGTLDPMATGVLLVGIGRATRLLGHLALTDKAYLATVLLGTTTSTDDADGEVLRTAPAAELAAVAALGEPGLRAALAGLTGEIEQVPPQVSAVKVAGRRSYAIARAGERVELAARRVTVHRLELLALRRGDALEADLDVVCSSGTYVRSLARDLGERLGCGGHLTALRRTRVGGFGIEAARTLDQLASDLDVVPLAAAVASAFPRRDVDAAQAATVRHGGRLPAAGLGPGPVGVFGPDGAVLALVEERDGAARPLCVFVGG